MSQIGEAKILESIVRIQKNASSMQIVFVDIVRYSSRKSHCQLSVVERFTADTRDALKLLAQEFQSELAVEGNDLRSNTVIIPLGDGALLAFPFTFSRKMHIEFVKCLLRLISFKNGEHPCKIFQNQGWCDCHDNYLVRSGVSEGLVILFRDINGNFNVAGTYVNLAARAMSFAEANQIFVAAEAHKNLTEHVPNIEDSFRKYPDVELKHGLRVELFQYLEPEISWIDSSPSTKLSPWLPTSPPDLSPVSGSGQPESHSDPVWSEKLKELPTMVRIPVQSLLIGTAEKSYNFLEVATTPVTQRQFMKVVGKNPSKFRADDHPVDSVKWFDAIEFCNKLSDLQGFRNFYKTDGREVTFDFRSDGFRLPFESEWESLCLAGEASLFYEDIGQFGWIKSNSAATTHPVGLKHKNPWGLFDFLGNVWEWCYDWFEVEPRTLDGIMGRSELQGVEKVIRGGSWASLPSMAHPTYRSRKAPMISDGEIGFRVVRSIFE